MNFFSFGCWKYELFSASCENRRLFSLILPGALGVFLIHRCLSARSWKLKGNPRPVSPSLSFSLPHSVFLPAVLTLYNSLLSSIWLCKFYPPVPPWILTSLLTQAGPQTHAQWPENTASEGKPWGSLCFPSLRNQFLMLSIVQCLNAAVLYIFSCWRLECEFGPDYLSWLEVKDQVFMF